MDTAPAVGVNYFQYKNFFLTFLQAVVTAEATVVEEATLNSPAAMAAATNKAEATKRILSLPWFSSTCFLLFRRPGLR